MALVLFYAPVLAAQTAPNWIQQFPPSSPSPRVFQSMAYDSTHGQVVMFGGQDYSGDDYADTWVWDGSNWLQKSPLHSPPAQSAHAMAYDSAHAQVVMFSLNDTWLWDGSDWTTSPPIGPSPRYGHAMAYDSAHGQVVLFGGAAADNNPVPTVLADTWVWNGSGWTQKFPKNSPPARYQHAIAFDSAQSKVVLFGGQSTNNFSDALADTWVWDGSNWTQELPHTSPTARTEHAMAYDSTHGQVVLFGGVGGTGTDGDTWAWDGVNWTQESPQANPPPRSQHTMAYDSAHDQLVLFGGNGAAVLGDTWTYGVGGVQITGPSVSGVISASDFGHLGSVAPGSWIEIYGTNLAPRARSWSSADFSDNIAPTSLDGVSVMVGGQPAFVDYISSGQVNALLPSGIPTGTGIVTAQLTITNGGVTGAPVNVPVNSSQPGLLAPENFLITGTQYVVARLPDGSYVLPAGAIAGIKSRPAKPGEIIVIYGVGFGAVTPPTPVGEIASGKSQLVAPFKISFGTTQAETPYSGLAPGFVGLYQFNVKVPDVPDSDTVPLAYTLGGTPGMQRLFTTVHQ